MARKTSRDGKNMPAIKNTLIRAAMPWDASESSIRQFAVKSLKTKEGKSHLKGSRYRILSVEPADEPDKNKPHAQPRDWVITAFDYTKNQALKMTAAFPTAQSKDVKVIKKNPLPSFEEWQEAVSIITKDKRLGPLLARNQVTPYRPMPPLSNKETPSGEVERTLHVGLLPTRGSRARHQIVAVDMVNERVNEFDKLAPERAIAAPTVCGIPVSNCPIPPRGTPGRTWISWPATNPVWKFLAIRPAASSGTRGSGLELRSVDYKGKRILNQAHVPVLNVRYDQDRCGPYRDWQYEEQCFKCIGTNIAPGFRWASSPPETICESDTDSGNFNGVAIHDTGEELVLVTEMQAGWYRYIMEWRFHIDGTIRPRFKFGAVANSCVCNIHHHHCYWRFDFDVRTSSNNLVEEFNDPPISGGKNWQNLKFEIKRLKDAAHKRKWRVSNTVTKEACEIEPGLNDGVADEFGRGDLWVLRYRANEIDDGYNQTTGPETPANLDKFITGEVTENQDLVVWYAAHFTHDVAGDPDNHCHEVGPTLTLSNW